MCPTPGSIRASPPIFDAFHLGPGLAYNLDKSGSTTMILERVNALIDMGALPADRATVFSFGEIDCRSHVVRQAERQSRPIEAIVGDICGNYRNFLGMMLARGIQPAVWGPVASTPNQDYADPDAPAYGSIEQRNFAIARFNAEMRDICARMRLPFLSVADRLIGPDQKTRSEYYCDDIHLSQRARSLLWDLMPDGEMVPPPPAPPPELRVAAHAPIATDLKEIVTFKANGGWTWFQTSG
jgi:hypothetical protein